MKKLFRLFGIAAAVATTGVAALAQPLPRPHATAAGGSHQLGALHGCIGQWLFNGLWRMRVLKIEPALRQASELPGYAMTIEVRNGAHQSTSLAATGVPILNLGGSLVMDDGNPLTLYRPDNIAWTNFYTQTLPPSAGSTQVLKFSYDAKPTIVGKPKKWLFEIQPGAAWHGQPRYTTSDPSLRVDLTCTASGGNR